MADKLHGWQREFALRDNLTQADFEAFDAAMSDLIDAGSVVDRVSANAGAALRAAIAAGWVETPECRTMTDNTTGETVYFYGGKPVAEIHPAAVMWLGGQVSSLYMRTLSAVPKAL